MNGGAGPDVSMEDVSASAKRPFEDVEPIAQAEVREGREGREGEWTADEQAAPSDPVQHDVKMEAGPLDWERGTHFNGSAEEGKSAVKVRVKVVKDTKARESRDKRESRRAKEAREATGRGGSSGEAVKLDNRPVRIRPPPYKPEDFDTLPKQPVLVACDIRGAQVRLWNCIDHPFNRSGFRYLPCEAAPSMPSLMYRQIELPPFTARLAYEDMNSAIVISKDAQTCSTEKGFRLARANVGVRSGDWFFECKILRGNGEGEGHVRVGWARREASMGGPVGFDGYSYAIRDREGQAVHLSRPRPSVGESFDTGDVIGLRIHLPPLEEQEDVVRDRIPIRYKGQLYFEQFEYVPTKDMEDLMIPIAMSGRTPPKTLPNSFISVYRNGKLMDTPFRDLNAFMAPHSKPSSLLGGREVDDGMLGYYPALSVFNSGTVRWNPGPTFEFPPSDAPCSMRPMSERYEEQIAEDIVWDLVDEIDFEIDDERSQHLEIDSQIKEIVQEY